MTYTTIDRPIAKSVNPTIRQVYIWVKVSQTWDKRGTSGSWDDVYIAEAVKVDASVPLSPQLDIYLNEITEYQQYATDPTCDIKVCCTLVAYHCGFDEVSNVRVEYGEEF